MTESRADTVDSTTFDLLSGATANTDGSFTASGSSYWLEESRDAAVAVVV